jgi:hypothetical protein
MPEQDPQPAQLERAPCDRARECSERLPALTGVRIGATEVPEQVRVI